MYGPSLAVTPLNFCESQSIVCSKPLPGLPVGCVTPNFPSSKRLAQPAPASSPTIPCLVFACLCLFVYIFLVFALATPSCSWAPKHTGMPLTSVFAHSAATLVTPLPLLSSLQTLARSRKFCSSDISFLPSSMSGAHPALSCCSLQVSPCIVIYLFMRLDHELWEDDDNSSFSLNFSVAGTEQVFNKCLLKKTSLMKSTELVSGSSFCS